MIKYGVHLQFRDMQKIHKIFVEINRVLPQVNCNRKRIISLKYLLFRIFKMMNLDNLVPRASPPHVPGSERGETLVGSGHVSPRIWEITNK